MRVVSTVHKAGWDVYGERWLAGVENWPESAEFVLYTEGFDLEHPRVQCRRIESVERAEAFKRQYAHYRPPAWNWSVVKFGNKVFAAHDALYDYTGQGVWLDADAITYARLPDGYVENLLPGGVYMAMFKRIAMPTETGFWVMDCAHAAHKRFMDTWIRWVESGAFKTLPQWCDATTLDATVRQFEKAGEIETVSLSTPHEREMHPMAKVHLAQFIDHLKGDRKNMDASPENVFRQAA